MEAGSINPETGTRTVQWKKGLAPKFNGNRNTMTKM